MVSNIPTDEVLNLLRNYYSIVPKSVSKLPSYANINYKVTINNLIRPVSDCKSALKCFLLKFCDVSNEFYFGNIDMQHAMSKHLHLHGINASIPMETTDGKTVVDYTFDGKRYSVQLLSFVDGVSINEAEMSKDEVIEIAFHMGQLCGRFHQVMKTFHYDVERASHHNPFHTEKAAMFDEKKLAYVKDSSMKNQLRRYMNLFKEHFLPRLSELRKGFIHGDISDTNIILQEGSKDGGKKHWEICGLIDMEDCGYCCIVGELGVSTAYAMLRAVSVEADPVEASRQTIQGYQSIQSLTAEEKEILFYVIANRLVVSYISASYESFLEPGNSLYLFTQAKNVPAVLNVLEDHGKDEMQKIWFGRMVDVCNEVS